MCWFVDGSVFDGQFFPGTKLAYGTFKWADGSRYAGEWVYVDTRHGLGVLKDAQGKTTFQEWEEGTLVRELRRVEFEAASTERLRKYLSDVKFL